jgi:hypothetical protein
MDVMVEVRGGADLTFVNPAGLYDAVPFVPQGIDTQQSGEASALTMGSSSHDFDSIHHAMIANGEIQMSVADILKASTNLRMRVGTSFGTANGDPVKVATNQIYAARYNGLTTTSSELGGDLISFVGSWYALQRGSQRWRFMPDNESGSTLRHFRAMYLPRSTTNPDIFFRPTPASADTWSAILAGSNGGATPYTTARFYQMCGGSGGIAVQTPYYSRYRYSLAKWVSDVAQIANGYSTAGALGIRNTFGSGVIPTRCLGDDFQFSYFVGIPVYCSSVVAAWTQVT